MCVCFNGLQTPGQEELRARSLWLNRQTHKHKLRKPIMSIIVGQDCKCTAWVPIDIAWPRLCVCVCVCIHESQRWWVCSVCGCHKVSPLISSIEAPSSLSTEGLVTMFNSTCSDILDSVAPFKKRGAKARTQPWWNNVTHTLRQECRNAERKWKKDKLQVSYGILRDFLIQYQLSLKTVKATYFSDIISNNSATHKVLFSVINKA